MNLGFFIIGIEFLHIRQNTSLGFKIFGCKIIHEPDACIREGISCGGHFQAAGHAAEKPRYQLPRLPATTLPHTVSILYCTHRHVEITRQYILDRCHTVFPILFGNPKDTNVITARVTLQIDEVNESDKNSLMLLIDSKLLYMPTFITHTRMHILAKYNAYFYVVMVITEVLLVLFCSHNEYWTPNISAQTNVVHHLLSVFPTPECR